MVRVRFSPSLRVLPALCLCAWVSACDSSSGETNDSSSPGTQNEDDEGDDSTDDDKDEDSTDKDEDSTDDENGDESDGESNEGDSDDEDESTDSENGDDDVSSETDDSTDDSDGDSSSEDDDNGDSSSEEDDDDTTTTGVDPEDNPGAGGSKACEAFTADETETITAAESEDEAAQVVLLPSISKAYRIKLPEGKKGYITYEIGEWDTTQAFYTDKEIEYAIIIPDGDTQMERTAIPECDDNGMTEQLIHFHHWNPAKVEFAAEGPREVWFMVYKSDI